MIPIDSSRYPSIHRVTHRCLVIHYWYLMIPLATSRYPFDTSGYPSLPFDTSWYPSDTHRYLTIPIWYHLIPVWYPMIPIWYLMLPIWYLMLPIWYLVTPITTSWYPCDRSRCLSLPFSVNMIPPATHRYQMILTSSSSLLPSKPSFIPTDTQIVTHYTSTLSTATYWYQSDTYEKHQYPDPYSICYWYPSGINEYT